MQLAEGNSEMSFDTIQQELLLEGSEVEAFIIDGNKFCLYMGHRHSPLGCFSGDLDLQQSLEQSRRGEEC